MRKETIALHAGFAPDSATKAVAVPIYQTVAFAFDSAEHGAALFNLEAEGYRYSRISNPTTVVLEKRVAELEGGVGSLCVSTGQAALYYALLNLVEIGSNIVSVPQLYGTTHTLFSHLLRDIGVTVRFAESDRAEAVECLIDHDTRAVFCESVGNPAGNVCDLQSLAEVAHAHGVPMVVDNTVATPILLRPIEFGADVVVHSLTKFMGGHGTTLGGAVVDSGNFPWAKYPDKFPRFNQPEPSYQGLVYAERFGRTAYIERCRSYLQRISGSVLSPLSAFLLLQGIETVALRVERHVANAKVVAQHLRNHPRVEWVNYAGFEDSRYYMLTQKYLGGNACSLITFGVVGGFDAGVRFYNALKLISRLVNLGDAKSLACHPASTTHRQMPAEAQAKAGVSPEMIRLSVGIEHVDDIIEDLDQGLAVAAKSQLAGGRKPITQS
jgi:O-acetylhomoserine (thiol)-lyase